MVYILSEINSQFEETYLKVREKEKRIYTDDEVKTLPFATDKNPHKDEWELREKSFKRFKKYLESKEENLRILDLGCGNGWFCGQLSKSFNHSFYCVDVNLTELKQAARVFKSEKLKFIYANIFAAEMLIGSFDLITINAAVQYFPDLQKMLVRLLSLIKERGEIHILDSPFYADDEVENAKKRTGDYYESIGSPEMADRYFHHTYGELGDFKRRYLYQPPSAIKRIRRLITPKDSPFPWIVIDK